MLIFLRSKLSLFVKYRILDTDLTYIMKKCCIIYPVTLIIILAQSSCNLLGILSHTDGMTV